MMAKEQDSDMEEKRYHGGIFFTDGTGPFFYVSRDRGNYFSALDSFRSVVDTNIWSKMPRTIDELAEAMGVTR